MKTKWKLIYRTTATHNNYWAQYDCYYENNFNILYRCILVSQNETVLPKTSYQEFSEIVNHKFHGIEVSIKHWQDSKDELIKCGINKIESVNA